MSNSLSSTRNVLIGLLCLVLPVSLMPAVTATAGSRVMHLERAHAHNDYEHDRPLFDALDRGFKSVEADVWLVDGQLLVAHDLIDIDPSRTLQSLYLDPLLKTVKRNDGSVYRKDGDYFHLLIDIKSEGESTYKAIDEALGKYASIITKFTGGNVDERAVTVVISGNRPRAFMESQNVRYAAYDGRLSDLDSGAPAAFIPLISDRWTSHFTWNGVGPMPESERQKLRTIVRTAHEDGRRLRFWETPDQQGQARANVWQVLLEERVDYINTDDLAGLSEFLRANDPKPTKPYVGRF